MHAYSIIVLWMHLIIQPTEEFRVLLLGLFVEKSYQCSLTRINHSLLLWSLSAFCEGVSEYVRAVLSD